MTSFRIVEFRESE